MAEPKIFTKNYVNAEDEISVANGGANTPYLYDRDPESQWVSSGAASDLTSAVIDVEFFEDGVAVDRTIDSLLLLNHNLEHWTLHAWDGSGFNTLLAEHTDDDEENTLVTFAEETTAKVRLTCISTQTADQEKRIGEFIVCALQHAFAQDMESYSIKYRELSSEQVMGDGSIHKMVTRWAQNRLQRYEAQAEFQFVSEADRLILKGIRDAGEPFLWQPESAARPSEVYLVYWSNPWQEKYVSSYKGAGIEIQMNLREV